MQFGLAMDRESLDIRIDNRVAKMWEAGFVDEVEELMKMDKDKIEALLSNGHDWASDHIATSKDDVEEVHNFFKTKMSSMNEKMLSAKQKKIASAAPPEDKITGADFAALRKK
jgi:tRNA A37 N6-isopentenylltransferase MiaA